MQISFNSLLFSLIVICDIKINAAFLLPELSGPAEDGKLDFLGLADKYGHPATPYEVTTEDGYILTMFHIPGRSKYPVLLMHGFLESSDGFLIRGEISLGITLANDGYDVWFGNSRGNRYSRKHVFLDPDTDPAYWNWSFDELGYYDLPAIIDTILNKTNSPSLSAIGHSRGNLIFYVLGSTRPEYNAKVNVMIALAPVCYYRNSQPPVSTLLETVPQVAQMLNQFHIEIPELLGYNSAPTKFLRAVCTFPVIGPGICLNLIFFPIVGYNPYGIEQSFVYVFIYHFPSGTASKDLLHFSQLRTGADFSKFDYGKDINLKIYNSPAPPLYNLSLVTMPIALLASRNDRLATLPDINLLNEQLPNVIDYTISKLAVMEHLDFVWGRHMPLYLFPDVFRVLYQYNKPIPQIQN